MEVRHPAPWNRLALSAAADRVIEIFDGAAVTVLDPFAGTGRIHELRDRGLDTVGLELEKEWASCSPYTAVGNALVAPFPDGSFQAIVTSPAWGNRMADHHEAKDPCRTCRGSGLADVLGRVPCPKCKGSGLTVRNTYRHALGRMPSSGSSGILAFGRSYRIFHHDWIVEARRLLPADGLLIVNVANHIQGVTEEVDVVGWWLGALMGEGFLVRAVDWIAAGKLRHGANHELRVEGEQNIVCQARP